jgi:CheY-like chemotaxis protein
MTMTTLTQAKILLVDDEKANIRFLEVILQEAGYTDVH